MTELWLKYTDERGDERRVPVGQERFTIGRHSDNDLAIPDSRLSRQHVKIDRFGSYFVASDMNSSNGTFLNGGRLDEPATLKDGDVLDLGGGCRIEVELVSSEPQRRRAAASGAGAHEGTAPANGSAIPTSVFIIAPLFGLLVLFCVGGIFFVTGDNTSVGKRSEDIVFSPSPDEELEEEADTPAPSPTASGPDNSGDNRAAGNPDANDATPQPTQRGLSDIQKVEQHSASFLRRIALNDPNAFLQSTQAEIISRRISQFRGSTALAENLKAVKRDAAQFESLAQSQGLKGQFLAAAALTKLGGSRGDPLAVAKAMLPTLGELRISLGNSLADDNLLIMADYLRREGNKRPSLQSILEAIPKSTTLEKADPREIRTIWYLRRNNKITDEYFEFALRFLAVGTIMQNPKEFNVSAEAVILN